MKYTIKTRLKLNVDGKDIMKDAYPISISSEKELTGTELAKLIKDEILIRPTWTILTETLLVNGTQSNLSDKVKETDNLEYSVTQNDPGNKDIPLDKQKLSHK